MNEMFLVNHSHCLVLSSYSCLKWYHFLWLVIQDDQNHSQIVTSWWQQQIWTLTSGQYIAMSLFDLMLKGLNSEKLQRASTHGWPKYVFTTSGPESRLSSIKCPSCGRILTIYMSTWIWWNDLRSESTRHVRYCTCPVLKRWLFYDTYRLSGSVYIY